MEFKEEFCIDVFKIYLSMGNQKFNNENSFFEKYFQFRKQFKDFISSKKNGPSLSVDTGEGENKI